MNRITIALVVMALGCAGQSPHDRASVSTELQKRTGDSLRPQSAPRTDGVSDTMWPPDVQVDDGLDEDEVVAVALWNSPMFQADLASLSLSRADLIDAGMIRNPLLTLFLPLGPKQLEFTATFPIEALWQRPRRIAAAQIEVERVARGLVLSGLDLVRDVRLAFTDVALASARRQIGEQALVLRKEISRITVAREKTGEISDLESQSVRLELARAEEELGLAVNDEALARLRLLVRMGLPANAKMSLVFRPHLKRVRRPFDEALREALALRPDVRAAELAIEAAAARVGWEKSKVLNQISAIADANGKGTKGFEIGPGFQMELPFGNRNEGAIARARAELERAAWLYAAVRQRVEGELRQADAEYAAVDTTLDDLRMRLLPAWDANVRRAQSAFASGDVPHLFVLEVTRQRLDTSLREADLDARLRRAAAELDRCLGRKRQ